MKNSSTRKFWLLISASMILYPLIICPAHADSPDYVTNSNLRGIVPFGSYQYGGIDTVNLGTGNLTLRIPLFTREGRGLDYGQTWTYNSKFWEVTPRLGMQSLQIIGYTWYPNYTGFEGAPKGTDEGRLEYKQGDYQCNSWDGTQPLPGDIWEHLAWNFVYISPDGAQYRFPNRDYWVTRQGVEKGPPCLTTKFNMDTIKRSLGPSDSGVMELDTSGPDYVIRFKDGRSQVFPRRLAFGPIKDRNGNIEFLGQPDTLGRSYIGNVSPDSPHIYTVTLPDSSGNPAVYSFEYGTVPVKTEFNPSSFWQVFQFSGQIYVMKKLTLPNGRAFTFEYDPNFGEVTHIGLPAGGSIDYEYTTAPEFDEGPDFVGGRLLDGRRVKKRTTSDGVNSSTWTYDYCRGYSCYPFEGDYNEYVTKYVTKVTDPEGNVSYHLFDDKGVHELETEIRRGEATPVRRITNEWTNDFGPVLWTDPMALEPTYDFRDWRIKATTATQLDVTPNLVSRVETDYDSYNYDFLWTRPGTRMNVVETREYGYDGDLVRRTKNTYLHDDQPIYADSRYHILDRIASQQVYDGQGILMAQTQYAYDTTPITATSGVVQHDYANYQNGFVHRGNLTETRNWLKYADEPETWLATTHWYDDLGNRIQTQDPRGKNTYFSYEDSWTNSSCVPAGGVGKAFVTKISNALGHTATSSYYACSSLIGSATDPNNQTKSYKYDSTDRITEVSLPDGGRRDYSYSDGENKITVEGLVNARGETLKSEFLYDGLERTRETRQYEGTGYIAAQTQYDSMGRVQQVSSPYRLGSENALWTRTEYDYLGRVKKVTTPDGASIKTDYSADGGGASTTMTDQAGKKRTAVTDAPGRLTGVIEDPDGAAFQTRYEYDALGNLRSVFQGIQTRSFDYDSLGRLRKAYNPESGTTYYQYDANGNLKQKADARLITTTYDYDDLNRLQTKSYSDGKTPTVTFTYDSSDENPIGRLTSVISENVSSYRYDRYDALGLIKATTQSTGASPPFSITYSYDLVGNMISETYPSGRTIRQDHDQAGRVKSVYGELGGMQKNYGSSLSYTAHGPIQALLFGNGLWEHTKFNTRLQAEQIGLGTSSTDSSKLELFFSYYNQDATKNNGNVTGQTITAPGASWTQSYTYDSLNRLQKASEMKDSVLTWSQTYAYDRYGNRAVSDSFGFNLSVLTPKSLSDFDSSNNRLMESIGWSYDSAGNLKRDVMGNLLEYDAEDRLISFNGTTTYAYDGGGRRVRKVEPTGTTLLIYDAMGRVVAEYADSPSTNPGGTRYLTQDHLRSTRVVTDQGGNIVARHDYLPFGEEIQSEVDGRTTVSGYGASDSTRQRFTGKEQDAESGLDYFGARYLSAPQGRFTSPDPIMVSEGRMINPQLWNTYSYVANNPLSAIDPRGEELVRLGQHTDQEIDELIRDLKERLKDKKLSKGERAAIKSQIETLKIEKEGNRMIGKMLEALKDKGELKGLKLSDFTLTTDTKNDFKGLGVPQDIINKMLQKEAFIVRSDEGGPPINNTIFIRTDGGTYQRSQFDPDFIYYGASLLRHEYRHFQIPGQETEALKQQLTILKLFQGDFQNRETYDSLVDFLQNEIKKYK